MWSFLYFPTRVFGVMSVTGRFRPGPTSVSGYVFDDGGMRSLADIEIVRHGEGEYKMPAKVEYRLPDVVGNSHTVIADVAHGLAQVPLVAEATGPGGFAYTVVENFCPIVLQESGETGLALVEIGFGHGALA
jgi:hypothetical protein